MARFDVYRHPDAKQRVATPFLLDVQNEYISGLQTRVVLPLRSAERVAIPLRGLNPALDVEGVAVMIVVSYGQKLSAAWARWLGLIPALSGLAFLVLFPLDAGFYSILIAVLSAVISFSAAYLCFAGYGEILAFSGFLLMASKFAVYGNAWIAWLTPLFAAAGFFLAGLSTVSVQGEGVDKD